MSKPRIILDCDPGHDDALAILMAAIYCDIVGITTVSGNVPLELTSLNALITTQILDLEIPVHAGADKPLVAAAKHAEHIHGESGLAGPQLPKLECQLAGHDAVRFIINAARTYDDLWLVATGPLTNVALALRNAPDIAQRLLGVSIMGGSSSFGNSTAVAEFNICADPEAADVVFSSGANLMMCGLNLTHQWTVDADLIEKIRDKNTPAAIFVAELLDFYCHAYAKRFFGKIAGPLHDPSAVLAVTHPALFDMQPRHVAIELAGQHTRGMTVVDERQIISQENANTQVAYHIESQKATELLLAAIDDFA